MYGGFSASRRDSVLIGSPVPYQWLTSAQSIGQPALYRGIVPAFARRHLARSVDGTTILHGLVRDQAELHGLPAKVRDLGTALISVTPLGVANSGDDAADSQQQQHP